MVLHAVYDSRGNIIAASRSDTEDTKSVPAPVPQPAESSYYAIIPLDESQARMPLDELCTTARVDLQQKRLIAKRDLSRG